MVGAASGCSRATAGVASLGKGAWWTSGRDRGGRVTAPGGESARAGRGPSSIPSTSGLGGDQVDSSSAALHNSARQRSRERLSLPPRKTIPGWGSARSPSSMLCFSETCESGSSLPCLARAGCSRFRLRSSPALAAQPRAGAAPGPRDDAPPARSAPPGRPARSARAAAAPARARACRRRRSGGPRAPGGG